MVIGSNQQRPSATLGLDKTRYPILLPPINWKRVRVSLHCHRELLLLHSLRESEEYLLHPLLKAAKSGPPLPQCFIFLTLPSLPPTPSHHLFYAPFPSTPPPFRKMSNKNKMDAHPPFFIFHRYTRRLISRHAPLSLRKRKGKILHHLDG